MRPRRPPVFGSILLKAVRRLVHRLDGILQVYTGEGEGMTVLLSLPLEAPNAERDATALEDGRAGAAGDYSTSR